LTLIEKSLGTQAVFVDRTTRAGLISLGGNKRRSLVCLVCDGVPDDSLAEQALYRLIRGLPTADLDGSPTGHERFRRIDRRLSCLLIRGDRCSDPAVLTRVITIRTTETPKSVEWDAQQRLGAFSSSASESSEADFSQLKELLDRTPWTAAVCVPTQFSIQAKINAVGDTDRLESLLSLAAVMRRLRTPVEIDTPLLNVEMVDIEAVLALLDDVGADDQRQRLSRQGVDFLRILQTLRPKQDLCSKTKPAHEKVGLFTISVLRNRIEFSAMSDDAIRDRFNELKGAGLLERCANLGHGHTFDLTNRGSVYLHGHLADSLRELLGLPPSPINFAKRLSGDVLAKAGGCATYSVNSAHSHNLPPEKENS